MAQQIVIDIVAETKKLTEGLNDANKQLGTVNGKLKGVAKAATAAASAFVLKQGISFLKQGIDEAKDAQAAMRGATTTFGEGSKALQKITDDAEKFGKQLAIDNDELIVLGTQLGSRLPDDVKASSVELIKVFKDVEAFTGGAVKAEAAAGKLAKAFADGELSAKELQKIFPNLEQSVYDQAEALSKAGKNQEALNLLIEGGAKKYGEAAEKNVTSTQRFETALANFKETLGVQVLPLVEKMLGFLTKLLEAFDKQPDWLKNFELGLLAIVGIGGPLISFVANLQASLVQLGLLPAASGAAATGLNLVKVALAGLGIGLVIAAIVLLIQHWDDVTKVVKDVYEAVKKWIGDMVENAKELLGDAIDWIKKNWPTILAVLTGPFGLFVKWLVDNKDDILQKAKDIYDTVKGWLEENWPKILAVLTGPFGLFALWVVTHKEDLKTKFGELWDAVKTKVVEKVENIIGTVVNWWKALKDWIVDFFSDKADSFLGAIKSGWNTVKDAVSDIVELIKVTVGFKFLEMFTKVTEVVGAIKTGVVDKFNELKDAAIEKFNQLKTAASKVWDNISGYIRDVATNIKEKLDSVYNSMVEVGKDIANGIIDGLFRIQGVFRTKLERWVKDNIPDWIKKVLQISSPSKVMAGIGTNIAQGLNLGLNTVKPGTIPSLAPSTVSKPVVNNITINAGAGTDQYALGRTVQSALNKYSRVSNTTGKYTVL